jgi:type II secretory pathway pseudopilin PulG
MPTGRDRVGERGYNLVALAMIIAVTTILVLAAAPLWSSRIQRDREEELISRGFQYAEAIRVFQKRFGRLPNRLEELLQIEPRSIRQLWKDPMTEEGAWAVIVELPGRGRMAFDSRTGAPLVPLDADGDGRPDPPPPAPPRPLDGGTVAVGPIHGVKSLARGDAFHELFEKSDFGDWEFTVDVLQTALAAPGPAGLPPRANALTLGRPFRYPPPGSLAPGVGLPGDREPPGGRPGPRSRPSPRPPPSGPRGGG